MWVTSVLRAAGCHGSGLGLCKCSRLSSNLSCGRRSIGSEFGRCRKSGKDTDANSHMLYNQCRDQTHQCSSYRRPTATSHQAHVMLSLDPMVSSSLSAPGGLVCHWPTLGTIAVANTRSSQKEAALRSTQLPADADAHAAMHEHDCDLMPHVQQPFCNQTASPYR